jgi:HK97 gp10 family phage protein
VHIGTNVNYAPYVEMGTGDYYPGGRQTPWAYQDMFGNWHRTKGQEAQPFLKPAVADHTQTYRNIMRDEMKK